MKNVDTHQAECLAGQRMIIPKKKKKTSALTASTQRRIATRASRDEPQAAQIHLIRDEGNHLYRRYDRNWPAWQA